MHVSVVGLGKLGSPLAAVFASWGHEVIGTDLVRARVDALSAGVAPVDEPGLQGLITAHQQRLRATCDCTAAVLDSELTFVIVPTPSDPDGRFTNEFIVQALRPIGAALQRKAGYHLVVVTSTVMPGAMDGEIRQALERESRRVVGRDLGLCYKPEFVALGSVVRDMLCPDVVLIGESDSGAGGLLAEVYAPHLGEKSAIQRMSLVNAELVKIAINTFVTTKISFANMLSDICDRLPGANIDVVTAAVGGDSRIGRKYLHGATGYGGPCFPRDNQAYISFARTLGARADLAEATDAINHYQLDRVVNAIVRRVATGGPIAILGLAYKPGTAVVEQSQGLALVEKLTAIGHRVVGYDPLAMAAAQAELRRPFEVAASAADAVRRASLVVVMTNCDEFATIPVAAFARERERLSVIDCWRVIPPTVGGVADLIYLGIEGSARGRRHDAGSQLSMEGPMIRTASFGREQR